MKEVALPWLQPTPLLVPPALARGLDLRTLHDGLARLAADPEVKALVAFGSRARGDGRPDSDLDLAVISAQPQLEPAIKLAAWNRHTKTLGRVGVGVDLIVNGWQDAAYLAQSRWPISARCTPTNWSACWLRQASPFPLSCWRFRSMRLRRATKKVHSPYPQPAMRSWRCSKQS